MHSLFEIQHLSYAYHTMQGETAALSDITFTVNTGDFVAIVGPSGCGKSTLLNLLAGMLTPESGTLLLNGTPLTADSRCHIGYMLQQDYLLEWRSIWKNVLLGLEIRHEVRTLVLKPDLLLLDEPFSALDYQTRLSVSNDIGSIIQKEKKTAILVTHDLAEAVSLADRIIILTERPGRIHRIIPVAFPEQLTPMERRDHADFKTYFNLIWKELHHETN